MSRIPLAESLIVLDANNDVCNVSRFCEATFNVLFAQLTEQEITSLNKTLYNLQMGIKETHRRTSGGSWYNSGYHRDD